MFNLNPILLWLALGVVLLIIETMTFNLYTIWFASGAVAAFIAGFFGGGLWWQFALFIVVTGVLLYFTRPLKRRIAIAESADIEKVIGSDGVVTSAIDNVKQTGEINISGQAWQARAIEEMAIEKGVEVVVVTSGSNKLMVRRK